MKRIFNNILIKNYLILIIFMFMLELGFRMISGNAVVDTALLRIFLGLNLLALGISFLLSWTNSSFSKFFIILFTFFLSSFVSLVAIPFVGEILAQRFGSSCSAAIQTGAQFLNIGIGYFDYKNKISTTKTDGGFSYIIKAKKDGIIQI